MLIERSRAKQRHHRARRVLLIRRLHPAQLAAKTSPIEQPNQTSHHQPPRQKNGANPRLVPLQAARLHPNQRHDPALHEPHRQGLRRLRHVPQMHQVRLLEAPRRVQHHPGRHLRQQGQSKERVPLVPGGEPRTNAGVERAGAQAGPARRAQAQQQIRGLGPLRLGQPERAVRRARRQGVVLAGAGARVDARAHLDELRRDLVAHRRHPSVH